MEMDRFLNGGKEEEQGLLEILRSSDNTREIENTCLLLAHHGTIYSLPVLAARMADTTVEMKEVFRQTAELILKKHNVPKEQWSDFCDPDQWKTHWNGPPESFLAFVEMFSMTAVDVPKTDDITDHFGEIFMKVIEVDLSPYQSFREMRICSKEGYLETFAQRVTDHLQSEFMVNDLLGDISINFVKAEIDQELYMSLQTDYFTTRLRQYLKFRDE
jgi:hypothetical protein